MVGWVLWCYIDDIIPHIRRKMLQTHPITYGSPLSNAEKVCKFSRFQSRKSNDFVTLQMTVSALKAKLGIWRGLVLGLG